MINIGNNSLSTKKKCQYCFTMFDYDLFFEVHIRACQDCRKKGFPDMQVTQFRCDCCSHIFSFYYSEEQKTVNRYFCHDCLQKKNEEALIFAKSTTSLHISELADEYKKILSGQKIGETVYDHIMKYPHDWRNWLVEDIFAAIAYLARSTEDFILEFQMPQHPSQIVKYNTRTQLVLFLKTGKTDLFPLRSAYIIKDGLDYVGSKLLRGLWVYET